jgi:hypothetical protein
MPAQAVTLTATYVDLYYALTVTGGTGSGSYTNGRQVAISADAPAAGKAFSQWAGDTQYVNNVTYTNALVTMSTNAVSLTATYVDVLYTLTVTGGSGGGSYTNGRQVAISASNLTGKAFVQWIGNTQYVNNVTYTNALVTMSTNAVSLTATYVDVLYTLTVTGGSGSGSSYTNAQVVDISADVPTTGMTFDKWTGDTQYVAGVSSSNTTVTMPAQAVALSATYKNLPGHYTLTVSNGNGSGAYTNAAQVTITAVAPEGTAFDRWIGDTQTVAGVFSLSTIVTMPAQDVALTAICENASNGVASVTWASSFIYYEPTWDSLLGPAGSGKSTIAQLMYSPDDIKDSILPGGAGAVNDVVWDTITLTEGVDDEYGAFSASTVRAGTNGYVYALIFQDNIVQAGDLYVAGPLAALVDGAADVNTCADPGNGEAINGVNSAQVVGGDPTYVLTVNSGNGSGSYTNGQQVAISADTPLEGQVFDKWTGDTQYVNNVTYTNALVTMSTNAVNLTATYADVLYALTVNSGSGSGSYTNTQVVAIAASAPASGKVFDKWIGDTAYVANSNSASTTVTMPAQAIALTATYKDVTYALTVASGSGSGSYTNAQVVAISASAPAAGLTFDKWIGDTQVVNNVTYTNALVTMPAQAVALSATYKNLPGWYTLTVSNGTGGGIYTNGARVTVTATAPNGTVFDRWTGATQIVDGVFSLSTIVTMPAQDAALTATCVGVSNGTVKVAWTATMGFYFSADPNTGILGPVSSGKSTIAQLMYSPDNAKDNILPGRAGAVNDVVWDTITLTEAGGESQWAVLDDSTVRTWTNGYVYALIFQDNNVQSGDWYFSTPLLPLVMATNIFPQSIEMNTDMFLGDAIDGVYGARVIEPIVLTVNSGNGSGTYTNGQKVAISANAPASGKVFDKWTGDTQVVNNVTYTNALVTLSSNAVSLTATYKDITYTLTVNSGTGTGSSYTNGQQVAIAANAPASGKVFDKWTGATQYVASASSSSSTVTIPTSNITLTATYADINYTLTVNSGSGSGSYTNGQQVAIAASNAPSGQVFDKWTGDTAYVANSNSVSTTVTMPASNIAVLATYKSASVTLTASAGAGGTISPTNASVLPGNSTNFVITASNYYRISTLTTNGASAGVTFNNISTNYTFVWSNVTASGTVTVSFVQQITTNAPAQVPYEWLASYFVTNDYNAAANADQDLDGLTSWQEYIAGTVPTNKASVFAVAQSNRNVVTWSPVTGRIYSVYWTTNLVKGFTNLNNNIPYPQSGYTNATPDPRVNHYQIKVRMQ